MVGDESYEASGFKCCHGEGVCIRVPGNFIDRNLGKWLEHAVGSALFKDPLKLIKKVWLRDVPLAHHLVSRVIPIYRII